MRKQNNDNFSQRVLVDLMPILMSYELACSRFFGVVVTVMMIMHGLNGDTGKVPQNNLFF